MHLSDVPNHLASFSFTMRIGSSLTCLLLVLFIAIASTESDSAGLGSVTAMESLTQRGERTCPPS